MSDFDKSKKARLEFSRPDFQRICNFYFILTSP